MKKVGLILALAAVLLVGKSFWLSRLFENLGNVQINRARLLNSLSDNEKRAILEDGRELFRRAVAEDINYSTAYASLGLSEHLLGNDAASIVALEKATQLDSGRALNHEWLAQAYWATGQTEKAIASAEKAESYPRLMEIGETLLDRQREDEATLAFQGALSVAPGNAGALYGIWRIQFKRMQRLTGEGDRYRKEKHYDLAAESYRRAAEALPESEDPYLSLAGNAFDQGEYAEAEAYLDVAMLKKPSNPWIYSLRSRIHREQGHQEEAVAALLEAIHQDPTGYWQRMDLADTYRKFGQRNEAIAQYKLAIEVDERKPDGHYELGLVLFEMKDYTGAVAELEKAVELSPKNGWYRLWLGDAYVKAKRPAEAKRQFEVASNDANPEIRSRALQELGTP